MSVGPLGFVAGGSFAATPLSQTKASEQTAQQRDSEQARSVQSERKAEMAAGIGQTEEHGDAQDRDADGRRPWELPGRTQAEPDVSDEQTTAAASRDPSGQRGNQLDLTG